MKKLYCALIFCFIISCSNSSSSKDVSNNLEEKRSNVYTITDFFKDYDSLKFTVNRYEDMTEILDSSNVTGEKGIYKFDKNNILRFYAFLLDEKNNYHFSIEYDSLGNEINKPSSNLVSWFTYKMKNDKFKVSLLLYTINYSYGDIEVKGLKVHPLFKSKYFSNLDAADVILSIPQKETVYITGKVRDDRTGEIGNFKDSLILP